MARQGPLQGCCKFKFAFTLLAHFFISERFNFRQSFRLQIHDELLFELPANQVDVDRLKKIVIRSCTEECAEELQLKVP